MKRLLLLAFTFIMACSPQKKMMREAAVLENGGLSEEAYKAYENIYHQTSSADARVGMRRTAGGILEFKLSSARAACMSGNYEEALSKYEEAFAYANGLRGLELSVSSLHEENYKNCRQEYIQVLFDQAQDLVLNEEYEEATKLINRIFSLDRNNQQARYLDILCEIIPLYNAGVKAMDIGMYREAYAYFDEVSRIDAGYKDVRKLKSDCLEAARYTIAYVPIRHNDVKRQVESSVSAAIKDAIVKLKDPFVQLVERENLEQLLLEQKQGMEGIFDAQTAIQAGELLGARYLVTGEIISFRSETGRLKENQLKGFLGKNTSAKRVKYMEYSRTRNIEISYRYQLVDALTGRIHASKTIPYAKTDKAVWAEFEGDHTMVYPGEWKFQLISSQEDYVNIRGKEDLDAKFEAPHEPRSEVDLLHDMFVYIGKEVADAVKAFRP